MRPSLKIILSVASLFCACLSFVVALDNGRWQAYVASSFFFSVFLLTVLRGRIARVFADYVCYCIVIFSVSFIINKIKVGGMDLINSIRFGFAYGAPAILYLIYRRSPFNEDIDENQ